MAKGKIEFKETIDERIFTIGERIAESLKPGIEEIERTKKVFEAMKESALAQLEVAKKLKNAPNRKDLLNTLKKEAELSKKVTLAKTALHKLEQSKIDTERKQIDLSKKKQQVQRSGIRLTEKERYEQRLLNRGKRESAVLSSKLSSEYDKLSVRLTKLRRRYKDVALVEGETSKNAKRLRDQIVKLDSALKRVDANVGQFQRNVGNYGKALQSASAAAKNMASALGLVGGAFLYVQVMKDALRVVKDFDKANATLASVLQVEREEMKALTDDAVRLGSETVKTANEVTQLQTAYARLGFEQKEILDLTESTIEGSIAMNAQLDETAELTGAVVNTFDDLSTTDAPKILDIMSLATAKSALNFEKLKTGIPIVAGAANEAGIPFTRLVALMGKLSDAGIDVSSSSTSLRNIFIDSAKQGLSYSQIIEKIKKSQDRLTEANDQFGKRAAVSASVLAKNIDKTEELDVALQNAGGTAKTMAEKELNTLDGSLQLLKSAWEGYILQLNESSNYSGKLSNAIKYLSSNLSQILNSLKVVTSAYIAYRLMVYLSRVQTSLMNHQFILSRTASLASAKGVSKTALAFGKLNKVLRANALGIALFAITGLVALFDKLTRSSAQVAQELNKGNDEFLEQAEKTSKANNELEEMIDRYDVLKSKTNLNVQEQKEFNKIVNKLATDIPGVVSGINDLGDSVEINGKKVREFIKLQNSNTTLKAKIQNDELQNSLKNLKKELSAFNELSKENGNVVSVKSLGSAYKKVNGELYKVTTTMSKMNKIRIAETKLTKRQELAFGEKEESIKKEIAETTISIEKNEDLIASITGVKNARQKQKTASIKEAKSKADEVLIVRKLTAQIKEQEARLRSLTKNGYENLTKKKADEIKETRKKIAAYKRELKQITGVTKAIKKTGDLERKLESERVKRLNGTFNLKKFLIVQDISFQKEIIENTKKSEKERLLALKEASKLEEELAFETAVNKLAIRKGFTREEVVQYLEEGEAKKSFLDKLGKEEQLIIEQYKAKKKAITKNKEDKEDEIEFKRIVDLAEKKKFEKEKELQNELENENKAFEKKEGVYANHENAVEERERRIAGIKKKYALDALNTQEGAIKKLLTSDKLSAVERAKNEAKLAEIKRQISDLSLTDFLEKNKTEIQKTKEKVNKIAQISSQLNSVLSDLSGALFDSNIQKIDDEISAHDTKYNKILENEYVTGQKRENIEKKRDLERDKLEKKKRSEQRKKAIFNKASAFAQASINTAQAITKTIGEAGFFGIPLAWIVGAMGAAQMATILAQPIPKYKRGRGKGKNEIAEVGDGFVHEVIEKKDGRAYLTPNIPTLTYLEADDVVHKDVDTYYSKGSKVAYYQNIFDKMTISGLNNQARKARNYQEKVIVQKMNETVIAKAIENNNHNLKRDIVGAINSSLLGAKTVNNINVEIPQEYTKF